MDAPLVTIVNHSESLLAMLEAALQDEGYRTSSCTISENVQGELISTQPALVILDLWLETQDSGLKVLQQLRDDPSTACIPVLVSTLDNHVLNSNRDKIEALQAEILPPPLELDKLIAAVERIIEQQEHTAD